MKHVEEPGWFLKKFPISSAASKGSTTCATPWCYHWPLSLSFDGHSAHSSSFCPCVPVPEKGFIIHSDTEGRNLMVSWSPLSLSHVLLFLASACVTSRFTHLGLRWHYLLYLAWTLPSLTWTGKSLSIRSLPSTLASTLLIVILQCQT